MGGRSIYFIHLANDGTRDSRPFPPRSVFIIRDGVMMALVSALSVAIRMTEKLVYPRARKKRIGKCPFRSGIAESEKPVEPSFPVQYPQ